MLISRGISPLQYGLVRKSNLLIFPLSLVLQVKQLQWRHYWLMRVEEKWAPSLSTTMLVKNGLTILIDFLIIDYCHHSWERSRTIFVSSGSCVTWWAPLPWSSWPCERPMNGGLIIDFRSPSINSVETTDFNVCVLYRLDSVCQSWRALR